MTKRKPLTWYESDLGPTPDCSTCVDRLHDLTFLSAVYSVGIEHPGDPLNLAKRAIDRWHAGYHRD